MKLIRHISILIAGSILLLHSMLPHEHHTELSEDQHVEAHETASSLLDFFQLAFHIDLGDEHLEKFDVAQQLPINVHLLLATIANFSFETDVSTDESPSFSIYEEKLDSLYYGRQLSLRGPPQIA